MDDRPLRLLIADDEPLLTELLEFRLAARGYETVTAHDGREALAKLDAQGAYHQYVAHKLEALGG